MRLQVHPGEQDGRMEEPESVKFKPPSSICQAQIYWHYWTFFCILPLESELECMEMARKDHLLGLIDKLVEGPI